MKNRFFYLIIILFLAVACETNQEGAQQSFPLSSVHLLESPFFKAQQADLKYMLALNPDRLLAPYLIDAGFDPLAPRYGNWESMGLDGHMGGHYLSALSYMYAATDNQEMKKRLDYMVEWLKRCQDKNGNGYVGGIPGGQAMWKEIGNGKIEASGFSLNGKWVPLYNIHKLFAGLRDAYQVGENDTARKILVKLTDWFYSLTENLTDAQVQEMLKSEHGGLNEVFADVYDITGDSKYLDLAERFSHRAILNPLLEHKDSLTGLHANTQIPKVIGYERIAGLAGKADWDSAASFFWNTVIDHRTVSIGGNSVREHFNPVDDYSEMIESNQGPETCNTYNMLKLTRELFLAHPEVKYMDYYERALYNHILTTEDPVNGGFVYFTPMRPRHYRVYSQPQQCFWCCVGSGLENHGKYGAMIYTHTDNDIFVNLFIPSTLSWKGKGINLRQETKFPAEPVSEITVNTDNPSAFAIYIRYPGWVRDGAMQVQVNGNEIPVKVSPSSYIRIKRRWKAGDVIRIILPMHVRVEYMPDNSPWASVEYGPVVLAAVTDTTDLVGLRADGSRMGHVANGPFYPIDEAPMVVTDKKDFSDEVKPVKGKPLTFTLSNLVYPGEDKNLQLVPFYTIHEARYLIYWPVTTQKGLTAKKQEMKEKEQKLLALQAVTIDQVAAGEQQPETEHNFKGENTWTGMNHDRLWRQARGWFSYDFVNKHNQATKLLITYYGKDNKAAYDILVNGKLLASEMQEDNGEEGFFTREYPLSSEMKSDQLQVKFVAHEKSNVRQIYHIRLVKGE
jgi:DUF1680 family protein